MATASEDILRSLSPLPYASWTLAIPYSQPTIGISRIQTSTMTKLRKTLMLDGDAAVIIKRIQIRHTRQGKRISESEVVEAALKEYWENVGKDATDL
jgi:hypothetical protein